MATLSLQNKITLITGGGSGINLAFAELALAQGSHILIADLKLSPEGSAFVERSRSGDGKGGNRKVVFEECDVTKRKDLENLVGVCLKAFGDVPDVWVAGAGVFEPKWSNFWDDTEEDSYAQFSINSIHPLKLSRIAIRSLLGAGKKGTILIVASLAGYQGTFSAPLYCASKHAVVGFVRSMTELEALEGVKVVLIAPGLVHTPLWTDHPEKMKQFGYIPELAITPGAVAQGMLDLIEEGRYAGGTCLEISITGTRELGIWNIPEPSYEGTTIPKESLEANHAPILEILQKEKGQLKR